MWDKRTPQCPLALSYELSYELAICDVFGSSPAVLSEVSPAFVLQHPCAVEAPFFFLLLVLLLPF